MDTKQEQDKSQTVTIKRPGRVYSYEIICSLCFKSANGWIASGELCRVKTVDAKSAAFLGETLRQEGRSVVIRPDFNEMDQSGMYFREWRSFDGEPLKEVRWDVESGPFSDLLARRNHEQANAVKKALKDLPDSDIWK